MTRSRHTIISAEFFLVFFEGEFDISIDQIFFKLLIPILYELVTGVRHVWWWEAVAAIVIHIADRFKHVEDV